MSTFIVIILSLGIVANAVGNYMLTRWLTSLTQQVQDLTWHNGRYSPEDRL